MIESNIAANDCPLAPAPKVTVHTRVLHRACQKAGGVEKLADYLRVSIILLHRWLEGEDVPPPAIFLKALDLILPEWGPEDDAMARTISANKPKQDG
jgi:hypothetical protein